MIKSLKKFAGVLFSNLAINFKRFSISFDILNVKETDAPPSTEKEPFFRPLPGLGMPVVPLGLPRPLPGLGMPVVPFGLPAPGRAPPRLPRLASRGAFFSAIFSGALFIKFFAVGKKQRLPLTIA